MTLRMNVWSMNDIGMRAVVLCALIIALVRRAILHKLKGGNGDGAVEGTEGGIMSVGDRKSEEEGPCTVWVDRCAAGDVTYSASRSQKDCNCSHLYNSSIRLPVEQHG
jgi:hypothetical protein